MAKRRRRGVSLGTIFMLLLTAAVVIGCVLFFTLLIGDDLHARTEALIHSLADQSLFEAAPAVYRELEATPAYLDLEDTPVPTAPPATPTPVPAPATITIAAAGAVYAPKSVR